MVNIQLSIIKISVSNWKYFHDKKRQNDIYLESLRTDYIYILDFKIQFFFLFSGGSLTL